MKTARERFKKFIEDFYLVLVLVLQQLEIEIPVGRIHLKMVHTDV